MTVEQRSRIKLLCRQIEVVQDENVLMQLICELQDLIKQWLGEVHRTSKIRQPDLDAFPTESKANGTGRGNGYSSNHGASIYATIVDDAIALMRSDCASLQMLHPERGPGGELRLSAFRGFSAHAAAFWKWVRPDSHTTCGMALRSHQRVVVPDLARCNFIVDSEDQKLFLQAGIHASQSTPLMARSGKMLGMISTHWRAPHQPTEDDFRLFDVLARQAADLIQREARKQEHW